MMMSPPVPLVVETCVCVFVFELVVMIFDIPRSLQSSLLEACIEQIRDAVGMHWVKVCILMSDICKVIFTS